MFSSSPSFYLDWDYQPLLEIKTNICHIFHWNLPNFPGRKTKQSILRLVFTKAGWKLHSGMFVDFPRWKSWFIVIQTFCWDGSVLIQVWQTSSRALLMSGFLMGMRLARCCGQLGTISPGACQHIRIVATREWGTWKCLNDSCLKVVMFSAWWKRRQMEARTALLNSSLSYHVCPSSCLKIRNNCFVRIK